MLTLFAGPIEFDFTWFDILYIYLLASFPFFILVLPIVALFVLISSWYKNKDVSKKKRTSPIKPLRNVLVVTVCVWLAPAAIMVPIAVLEFILTSF